MTDLCKLAEAATPRPWHTDTGVIFGDINNGKWEGDNPPVLMPLTDKGGGFTKRGVADAKFATYCVNSHEALTTRVAELTKLLLRAEEELRLIGMKDSGAVYDTTLRTELSLALLEARRAAAMEGK